MRTCAFTLVSEILDARTPSSKTENEKWSVCLFLPLCMHLNNSCIFDIFFFFFARTRSKELNLRFVESSLLFVESSLRLVESSLRLVESSLLFVESSLRFVESSLRFVESSLHRKNQVFVNAPSYTVPASGKQLKTEYDFNVWMRLCHKISENREIKTTAET